MPPGHHSHSSHHSSHSSHHSSHSSHSSGSHHSSTRTVKKTRMVPRAMRNRTNQPTNYNGVRSTRKYKCRHHDYVYYGSDWTDPATNTSYRRGYYTETGERYDNLILEDKGNFESTFECSYCGTISKETWKEGAIPHCPNCGANFLEMPGETITDSIDNSMVQETYFAQASNNISTITSIIAFVIAITVALGCFIFAFASSVKNGLSRNDTPSVDSNLFLFGDTIHVDSIDRDLHWNTEYESYYDPDTDCYVWYNTDVEPAVWQYWYEDISSDFGDYGWMEYELDEDQWYIEDRDSHWIELPDSYDTSNLWYITGDLAGTSYSQDYNLENFGVSINIDDSESMYLWNEDMNSYYVHDQDCYVRVNFDVSPFTIQYWYPDISDDFESNNGGWMEYDYNENQWYVEDSEGNWIKLPNRYDNDSIWHVENSIHGISGTQVDAIN